MNGVKGNVDSIKKDFSFRRVHESSNTIKRGCFSGAIGPEKGDIVSRMDTTIKIIFFCRIFLSDEWGERSDMNHGA